MDTSYSMHPFQQPWKRVFFHLSIPFYHNLTPMSIVSTEKSFGKFWNITTQKSSQKTIKSVELVLTKVAIGKLLKNKTVKSTWIFSIDIIKNISYYTSAYKECARDKLYDHTATSQKALVLKLGWWVIKETYHQWWVYFLLSFRRLYN